MQQPRPFKIDLQISRRRQSTAHPIPRDTTFLDHSQMLKKGKYKKMITLTMTNRELTRPKMPTNPESKYQQQCADISQFTLQQEEPLKCRLQDQDRQVNKNGEQLELQRQLKTSVYEKHNVQQGQGWWQHINGKEQLDRQKLIKSLRKTEKQIRFFTQMLQEKKQKFSLQQQSKIANYESYLLNLYKIYHQELLAPNPSQQSIQSVNIQKQIQQEDLYRRLRYNINQDGKRGLNFSPKAISVFSGASQTILLSYEDSIRRGQNFSFGSSKKIQNRTFSASKDSTSLFLNPGRACVSRRRLDFQDV